MTVIDASAMVEVLVGRDVDEDLLEIVANEVLQAPHHLDVEVLNALRGLALGKKITISQATTARTAYLSLSLFRYEIPPLAERVWKLRKNFNAYDASYIALAETLNVPLVTCDEKLVGANHAYITVHPRS